MAGSPVVPSTGKREAGAEVEFGGDRLGEEAGPSPSNPLPPRPVRARASGTQAWCAPTPIVPENAHEGPVTTRVSMAEATGGDRGGLE